MATKLELKYQLELTPSTYSLSVKVVLLDGTDAVRGEDIKVEKNLQPALIINTGVNAAALYEETGPLPTTSEKVTYYFSINTPYTLEMLEVTLPARNATVVDDNDPVSLILQRLDDGAGNYNVVIRCLKGRGYGVKTTAKTLYQNAMTDVPLGDDGVGMFDCGNLAEGDKHKLVVTVDGIEESATLMIKRPKAKPTNKPWSLKTNNGRARWLMIIIGILLIIGIFGAIYGWNPILTAELFRGSDGLTVQQQLHNELAFGGQVIPVKTVASDFWSHYWGNWTVFFLLGTIYWLMSWREEIADGVSDTIQSLIDRDHDRAQDPWLQRMMTMSSSFAAARSKKAKAQVLIGGNTSQATDTSTAGNGHPSLATLFKLDLMSDILVELVPAVLKRIFSSK